jgi:hypothetical protein
MECEAKAFFVINLGVVGWIAFLLREREREREREKKIHLYSLHVKACCDQEKQRKSSCIFLVDEVSGFLRAWETTSKRHTHTHKHTHKHTCMHIKLYYYLHEWTYFQKALRSKHMLKQLG